MKKHNSSENVRKTNKENEIIVDLWDLNSYGVTNRNINKSNKHTSTPSITSTSPRAGGILRQTNSFP